MRPPRWLTIGMLFPLACSTGVSIPDGLPTPADFSPRALPTDGRSRVISTDLWSIGSLDMGDWLTVIIDADSAPDIYFLAEDGAIVDAGGATRSASFFVQESGKYYLLLVPTDSELLGKITVEVDSDQKPPQRNQQVFVIDFGGSDGSVSPLPKGDGSPCQASHALCPFDLADMAPDGDKESEDFLRGLQPLVESLVVERLCAIFGESGIEISLDPPADLAEDSYSTVFFTSNIGPESANSFDSTKSASGRQILYGAAPLDLGNGVADDDAIVFFGSFAHQEGLLTSVGDLVNILSHAAAHEMGHLLGLQHVFRLSDIMWGEPTATFTRDIDFCRGQVVFGDATFEFVEFLYQDPTRYLKTLLGSEGCEAPVETASSPPS